MFAEPYAFTISDPRGRWTIEARHEDEVVRGKPRRTMRARCSCAWMVAFSPRTFGGPASLDRVLEHLRRHQLEAMPAAYSIKRECDGWAQVILVAGVMHCSSVDCQQLKPKDFRAPLFGEPCPEHGGKLYDRVYHWSVADPEDYVAEPKEPSQGGIRDAGGKLWHYWCAPIEARRLFGFVRAEEVEAAR